MHSAFLLAAASLTRLADGKVFSPNEDFLAFPQYRIVFSDSYILNTDAETSLALGSSYSSAKAQSTDSATSSESSAIATQRKHGEKSVSQQTYEYMILDSDPYLCSIPQPIEKKNETGTIRSEEEESKELARATDRGSELLKGLKQCLYFTSGWWSYSFCKNKAVEQFHALPAGKGSSTTPQKDDTVPSFVLGRAPNDKTSESSIAKARGDVRYMVQKLDHGTICDITGRPRQVQVQYHCFPGAIDRIGLIKEVATCSYLMIVYTARLCGDVAFESSKHEEILSVECKAIIHESEIEAWQERREMKNTLEPDTEKPSRPIVGDIELGGQRVVGSEGRRIEAPKAPIVQEAAGEIVVRYHPNENGGKLQHMPTSRFESLDLDPSAVQEMTEAMQELAGNTPWSLRVATKADGIRELRGMLEPEDDGEEMQPQDQNRDEDNSEGSEETYQDVVPKDEL